MDHPTLVRFESKLFEILSYSVWYAIHVNFIFSVFFEPIFNLRGPHGQNPRTTCGPRTTIWETLGYGMNDRETVVRSPSRVSDSSALIQRPDRIWCQDDLVYSNVNACCFPGDKAIRPWSWSLPSIYYRWLLRLKFVNILRTVREQDWRVGLVSSGRDFSVNKISPLGC
jgi:hypothetical protein